MLLHLLLDLSHKIVVVYRIRTYCIQYLTYDVFFVDFINFEHCVSIKGRYVHRYLGFCEICRLQFIYLNAAVILAKVMYDLAMIYR